MHDLSNDPWPVFTMDDVGSKARPYRRQVDSVGAAHPLNFSTWQLALNV
jgi:hypothetical protein